MAKRTPPKGKRSSKRGMATKRRRTRFKVMAGLFDFFGSLGSFVLILAFMVLLVTMLTWLRQDVAQTFATITSSFTSAIVQPSGDDGQAAGQQMPEQPVPANPAGQ